MRNDYFKAEEYLKSGLCLEIGPLTNPILFPENSNTRFLDIYSQGELTRKYVDDPNVDKSKIVPVHYVCKERSYAGIIKSDRFKLVVASHIIQSVPNLVKWLQDVESVMLERGVLKLAIPDKRYCFDFRRRLSNITDIMGAFIEDRQMPSPASVYDHIMFAHHESCSDPRIHHSGNSPVNFVVKKEYHALAYGLAKESVHSYMDVHCWQWIPETFTEQMRFLYQNNFIGLKLIEEETLPTQVNEMEFFVTLKKIRNI